jgi:hypothetical protein
MSSQARQAHARVEQDVLAAVILNLYRDRLRPAVLNECHFDLRAELIMDMINYFETHALMAAIGDVVHEIITDLQQLMPTAEQIADSRNSSTKRYVRLAQPGA